MTKHLRKTIDVVSKFIPVTENILEIGSRQEKNQKSITNLRKLFLFKKYIGLDIRKGPGVDIVGNGENLPFENNKFSLVICLETLEHTKNPWKMASEIMRVLNHNGTVIISSQQNYPLHKHPSDYYRYTPFGISNLFDKLKEKLVINISPPFLNEVKMNPQLVILIGWKQKNRILRDKIKESLIRNKIYISGHKPYRHRILDFFKLQIRSFQELSFRQELLFINTDD